ncbi:MAG: tRNA (adenosine(37)-N6)-dimethylallyltransferase MiaA [Bacteroidaceae bacterium]|nr:tRNA (adenosine(37)-N6)-dimethylallyltransferase MiaA [Prevotellaceae bacterium]MDY5631329.1 tRNA (adenosine(37)-N6)-dimethylallyltransferase MiaA [Bacteroidaceae bacterium]
MKTLVVLMGPTAVGKTDLSLQLAEHLACPILNCDSRQIYRDLRIGTAAPTQQQLSRVKHYFVGTLALEEYYSAARYESDVLQLSEKLFQTHDTLLMSGGSMLYIDAVCKGIDDIPTIDDRTRLLVKQRLEQEGLENLFQQLRQLDPEYANVVDRQNTRRVVHALEICLMTGKTYTSFRVNKRKERPFNILKIGLTRPREQLFERISLRVDDMMREGLPEEARQLLPYRHLNALNTVGYKEMFQVLDGVWESAMAVERLKKNTRVYAKKQMTWFQKDPEIHWFHPDERNQIRELIDLTTNRQ